MPTRFSAHSNQLLGLLTKGQTFDDLLLFKPLLDPQLEAKYKVYTHLVAQEKAGHKAVSPEKLREMREANAKYLDYMKERNFYERNNTHVCVGETDQIGYDRLVTTHSAFEHNMDVLCAQQQPVAYFIPKKTMDTIEQSKVMLIKKLPDLVGDLPDETGLLIFPIPLEEGFNLTIGYQIGNGGLSALSISENMATKQMLVTQFFHFDFKNDLIHTSGESDQLMSVIVLSALLFIHFFEVEKVVAVQPVSNARSRAHVELNGEKYISELTYPVNVIDATWYTTIIQDDPFLVKGHFRKQPYGPGRSQYKVRWISPFMKKGYHRQAKQSNSQASSHLLWNPESE